jgi:DNA-binding response OmpR family regulator
LDRSTHPERPRRVLVLEDDMALEPLLTRVIQAVSNGALVDWVTNVEEAKFRLKMWPNHQNPKYDLIIADIFLEGRETGLDFWQSCQFLVPNIPVLLMSSMAIDQFFTMLGQNVIAPPFIAKPIDIGECRQRIKGLLEYEQAA